MAKEEDKDEGGGGGREINHESLKIGKEKRKLRIKKRESQSCLKPHL